MVMGLAMLDKGKHFPQSYARMLFSVLGIHQDGQLLITIDPWDERRARELMQEELMLRLYNHVYADPVYWNNLGVEDRIFQLASAIAVVEPDAVFCGSTAALLYGIGSAYTLLDKVQVLLPRSTRRDTYEFVEYKRWRPGEVWRLGLFTLTDPCRTVVDIARSSAFRYALGYVDGLAREYDVEREELRAYAQANCRGLHGIARAFDVFEYMDGRSDNGGESEARAAMILAGVVAPELQVEITRPGNAGYYLADYGWQMSDGSWTLAELHGLGKFEDEAQNDPEQAAAKTYRAALMRDANLRAMGHNIIHFKLSDTYDVESFGAMMRGYGIPTTKPYAESR